MTRLAESIQPPITAEKLSKLRTEGVRVRIAVDDSLMTIVLCPMATSKPPYGYGYIEGQPNNLVRLSVVGEGNEQQLVGSRV